MSFSGCHVLGVCEEGELCDLEKHLYNTFQCVRQLKGFFFLFLFKHTEYAWSNLFGNFEFQMVKEK